jgi:hypothetical protein
MIDDYNNIIAPTNDCAWEGSSAMRQRTAAEFELFKFLMHETFE